MSKGGLHPCSVYVVVGSHQGVVNSIFLAVGILPSAETKSWDGSNGVDLELCRYFVYFW